MAKKQFIYATFKQLKLKFNEVFKVNKIFVWKAAECLSINLWKEWYLKICFPWQLWNDCKLGMTENFAMQLWTYIPRSLQGTSCPIIICVTYFNLTTRLYFSFIWNTYNGKFRRFWCFRCWWFLKKSKGECPHFHTKGGGLLTCDADLNCDLVLNQTTKCAIQVCMQKIREKSLVIKSEGFFGL